jgi:hypothetical protein
MARGLPTKFDLRSLSCNKGPEMPSWKLIFAGLRLTLPAPSRNSIPVAGDMDGGVAGARNLQPGTVIRPA